MMAQKREMLLELTTRASGLLLPDRYFKFATGIGQKTLDTAFAYTQLGFIEPSKRMKERIEAEMPINEAKIGAQYVGIAAKTKAERIAKLSQAVKQVDLPKEEVTELETMREQIAAGRMFGSKHADLYTEAVEQMEKQLVTKMEDVVKEADLPTDELDAMKRDIKTYSIVGHGAIAQAILNAEIEEQVPDAVTLATVNIARKVDTQPRLLVPTGWISEIQAVQAEHLIAEVPTRVNL